MKRISWIFTTVVALTFAATAQAQVPSLINYQGRLTDKVGTPVNGPVNIGIKIFDAATDGKAYYSEDLGQVSVSNGIYSFDYGNGKSLAETTEIMGTGDGIEKVFTFDVSKLPIIGKVSISDGNNTWTSDNSTQQSEILGTVDNNAGNVRAIFLNIAPIKGQEISVTYEHYEDGLFDSLLRASQPWMELYIDGKPLSPRQRIVAVPYASVSQYSVRNEVAERNSKLLDKIAKIVLSQDQPFSFHGNNEVRYNLGSENVSFINLKAGDVFSGAVQNLGGYLVNKVVINDRTNMLHSYQNGFYFWTLVAKEQRGSDGYIAGPLNIDVVKTDYVPYMVGITHPVTGAGAQILYSDGSYFSTESINQKLRVTRDLYLNPFPRKEIKQIVNKANRRPFHHYGSLYVYSIHHVYLETRFPQYSSQVPTKLKIELGGINIERLFDFFHVTIKILDKPDVDPIQFLNNGQEITMDFSKKGNVHFDFKLKENVEVKPFDINFILQSILYTVK